MKQREMSEGHGSSMHFVEIRSEVEIITQMSQGSENEHACVYSCWRYIYIYIHIYVYIIHVGMYIYIYICTCDFEPSKLLSTASGHMFNHSVYSKPDANSF